jgi:hypothetical protein
MRPGRHGRVAKRLWLDVPGGAKRRQEHPTTSLILYNWNQGKAAEKHRLRVERLTAKLYPLCGRRSAKMTSQFSKAGVKSIWFH